MTLLPRPAAPASLVVELARIVGADRVSIRDADRLAYGHDAWVHDLIRRRGGQVVAAAEVVVWPASTREVADVLALAARRSVPVVPFGAGSGRVGGARPSRGGIVLDLKRMRALRRVDGGDLRVEVETGIIGARLERALNRRGLTLGHFPASIGCSTLGGWLAARSAGQMSSLYGKIEDMTLGLEIVTPSGVARVDGRARPGPGPDWTALTLGSEGCFGAITAAELRVRPLPESRELVGYRFRSVEQGIEGIRRLMRVGLRPAVVRLYDALDTLLGRGGWGDAAGMTEASGLDVLSPRLPRWMAGRGRWSDGAERVRRGLVRRTTRAVFGAPLVLNKALEALPDECLLVLGFEGTPAVTRAEMELARAILDTEGAEHLGPEPGEHWLRHRYDVSFKQSKIFESGLFVDTLEVAATWDRLLPLHRAVRRAIAREAVVMAHFAHAYPEGCSVYFTFTGTAGEPRDVEQAIERHARVWAAALVAVHETGGTVSHHHGVGEAKASAMRRELGPGGTRLLAAVAHAFDPGQVMNPGKLGIEPYLPPRPRARDLREGLPVAIAAAVGERNLLVRGGRTVVRPPDERALAAVARVAHARGILLASDQSADHGEGADRVQVDMGRLEGVTRISEHSSFIECEAGVSVERLEAVLASNGLTLGPLHPAARELSVGAALARNVLIRRSVGLGDLGAICFSVRALLATGEAVETRAVPRSATGPDLSRAFVGGEGRFGLITKATLRVAPKPLQQTQLRYALPTFELAITVARDMFRAGLRPWAARAWAVEEGGEVVADLAAPSESILAARAAIFVAAAERAGGRRVASEPKMAEGGRFDSVVEIEVAWSRVAALAQMVQSVTWGEVWVDFMCPEAATVVVRVRDATARRAATEQARALGGRVVDAPAPDETDPLGLAGGGFAAIERALGQALDPAPSER